MIRQAISCDICASEKKQTNHWFVAYEQAGELRVSGWNSRNRQRPGAKHLCGQTCLHKLVDDFMARTIVRTPVMAESADAFDQDLEYAHAAAAPTSARVALAQPAAAETRYAAASRALATDTSLTQPAARRSALKESHAAAVQTAVEAELDEFESSARLIPAAAAAAITPTPIHRASAELVRMPGRNLAVEERPPAPAETPRYTSRNWRSEAWERERERELRAAARMRSSG